MIFFSILLQTYLGNIFFWVFETHKYIGKTFDWRKWKDENLAMMVWSLAISMLIAIMFFIDPQNAAYALKFMGLNVPEALSQFSMTGVILGLLIGYITKRILKKKRNA